MNQRTTTQNQVAPGWQRMVDAEGQAQYMPPPPRPAPLLHAWQQPIDGIHERHIEAQEVSR